MTACAALLACRPEARGLCSTTADCRPGAVCADQGICITPTGECAAACAPGVEVCSGGVCEIVKPTLSVSAPPGGLISPSKNVVHVNVVASPRIALGALHVAVSSGNAEQVAADLDPVQAGDNAVVLPVSAFAAFEGQVSVVAELRYTRPGGPVAESVRSVSVPALYDAVPPEVNVLLAKGEGEVNGWFSRAGKDLEVQAEVTDGAQGSGAQSARLTLDPCNPRTPCHFDGVAVGATGGATATFSFKVPRAVQEPGAEAPVEFHVDGLDRAGNAAAKAGTLRIDDAPPVFGAVSLLSTGVKGEDGRTWFAGGPAAPAIEIAVKLTDAGVGLAPDSLLLRLVEADVTGGLPQPPVPGAPNPADGTVHFRVPASAIAGSEGELRFGIDASDLLGHAAQLAPAEATALWIDDLPPQVTVAAVDYAATSPDFLSVCGDASPGTALACGRGPASAPDHVLRDDTALVAFEVVDCGVGVSASGGMVSASFTARTPAGRTRTGSATDTGSSRAGSCANGNRVHRVTFALNVDRDLDPSEPPDSPATGTLHVALSAAATDLLGHAGASPSGNALPGALLASQWRWKRPLSAGSPAPLATGSPLLLPAASSSARTVVVGVAAAAGNVVAVRPDGTLAWSASLASPPGHDLAAGPSGALYGASGGGQSLFVIPAVGSNADPAPRLCTVANVTFDSSPFLWPLPGLAGEAAGAVATAQSATTTNLVAFQIPPGASTCKATELSVVSTDASVFTAGSEARGQVFLSDAVGFLSASPSASNTTVAGTTYQGAGRASATSAVALLGSDPGVQRPVLGASDAHVYRSQLKASCAGALGSPCWNDLPAWTASSSSGKATAAVLDTPVFDESLVAAADANGTVTAWALSDGHPLWQSASPAAAPRSITAASSGPVLLRAAGQASKALVLASDGNLVTLEAPQGPQTRVPPLAAATLFLTVAPFSSNTTAARPWSPVADPRAAGSIAYLTDGAGTLWAVQLPLPPLPASASAWPRPARDSCNSRSADALCP